MYRFITDLNSEVGPATYAEVIPTRVTRSRNSRRSTETSSAAVNEVEMEITETLVKGEKRKRFEAEEWNYPYVHAHGTRKTHYNYSFSPFASNFSSNCKMAAERSCRLPRSSMTPPKLSLIRH